MDEMQKLVIDRNIWGRGSGCGSGVLFNPPDGRMCCLGIYSGQCGVPKEVLKDKGNPEKLPYEYRELVKDKCPLLFEECSDGSVSSELAQHLMETNDDSYCDDDYREAKLKTLFSQAGIEVTFIN